ncbi:MAG: PDZ domain-containing protein [Planctomycetes bacterium]|nr:PDZ domain-containing protein [Planctomycetota bacterium]
MRHLLLAGLALLAALLPARADTVETRDGQRFDGDVISETDAHLTLRGRYGALTIDKKDIVRRERAARTLRLADGSVVTGQVVRRTDDEVILRTAHGVLVIPAGDVHALDGAPTAAAPAVAADPARVRTLHREASRKHQAKDYQGALGLYLELLTFAPDDATALYNAACAYSLLGSRPEAVVFLERAVAAGFTDFAHIRSDTDLDPLRAEPGYLRLLAEEATWVRRAAAQATTRLMADMRRRGCKADYQVFVDEQRNIIYVHTKTAERLAVARQQLDEYARVQWRDLFRNQLRQPLHIVLLTREDNNAMLDRGVGGYFNPGTNVLVCGDLPGMTLNRSNVVVHEFTHALHFADQAARGQPHPIWLVEGLASLFESATLVDDRLVPRHSARLSTVQAAARRGQTVPWRRIMQMSQSSFMQDAGLAYAQARYMLFYMWEHGLLKRFYDEYTQASSFQGDRTALESFEVAFGRPLDEVERDWRAWVLRQQEPPIPFIGVRTEKAEDGCRVEVVVAGSGAEKAGLRVGDVLTAAGGTPLRDPDDVLEVLSAHDVGDVVEFEVVRGGEPLSVKVTLGERR